MKSLTDPQIRAFAEELFAIGFACGYMLEPGVDCNEVHGVNANTRDLLIEKFLATGYMVEPEKK